MRAQAFVLPEYYIAKLNSNFNFNLSLSFELSLALLTNIPTTHLTTQPPTQPPNRVSIERSLDYIQLWSTLINYDQALIKLRSNLDKTTYT